MKLNKALFILNKTIYLKCQKQLFNLEYSAKIKVLELWKTQKFWASYGKNL